MSQELRRVKRLEKLRAHHQKCEKRMDAAQTLLLMKANIEHSTGEHIKELSPDEPKDCSPSSPHQTLFSAGNHLPSPSSPTEDESELSSHSGSDEEYHPPAAASSSSSTEDELLTNELASQRVPEKHECDSSSKETEIIGAKSNKDSKQSGARSKKGTEQSHRLGRGPVSRTTRSLRGNDADTHLEVHDDEEQMSLSVQRPRRGPDGDDADGEELHSPAASLPPTRRPKDEDDGSDDCRDEEMTWEPIRRPDDKQQEEITTKKRYEKDEDKQEPDTTAAIKHADDNNDYDGDDDDDDDDENRDKKKLSMNTKRAFKRPKKTAVKRKRDSDDCDEEDGEDRHRTATKSSVKNQKKTASQRPCSDDAVDVPVSKPAKRPWTETEKNAVRRQMGKFMALRKVPGKNDCRMCIEKESASLGARTWRDVKYFVYNEIIKIKRKFQNR
ncbi:glutamic acid-rich protein-like isoform X4 [Boleophthalmus pectinirostris]|uniref:glutamic acid-rich protein-like isoform X4 n=1 Tax=Boleophthalmus pectinirostris TaxID=150288 RepID=UPI00242D4744|nr:glutamic acid-rich protein-like isoform X4 [Boleophthalmus pectinirostris]